MLRATLISSAQSRGGLAALESLLQTLRPADFAADQNLSLKDFVSKYTTLPTDPASNKAAQQAIATLSGATTIAQLLGLNQTIAANLELFNRFRPRRLRTPKVSRMDTNESLEREIADRKNRRQFGR